MHEHVVVGPPTGVAVSDGHASDAGARSISTSSVLPDRGADRSTSFAVVLVVVVLLCNVPLRQLAAAPRSAAVIANASHGRTPRMFII